jgi:two-component system KDP operon response regulator KdpE
LHDGNSALEVLASEHPDIVLLDVVMPDMNGFAVLDSLRRFSEVPVIMLSVRREEQDKVRALELGADDYITKPFGSQELMARIKAVLRRAGLPVPGTEPAREAALSTFVCGDLSIDYGSRRVTMAGRPVQLTPTEYRLLYTLARCANRVLSGQALLARVWGSEHRGDSDFLKTYVRRLRQKIEKDPSMPNYILTERGEGYRLAVK